MLRVLAFNPAWLGAAGLAVKTERLSAAGLVVKTWRLGAAGLVVKTWRLGAAGLAINPAWLGAMGWWSILGGLVLLVLVVNPAGCGVVVCCLVNLV